MKWRGVEQHFVSCGEKFRHCVTRATCVPLFAYLLIAFSWSHRPACISNPRSMVTKWGGRWWGRWVWCEVSFVPYMCDGIEWVPLWVGLDSEFDTYGDSVAKVLFLIEIMGHFGLNFFFFGSIFVCLFQAKCWEWVAVDKIACISTGLPTPRDFPVYKWSSMCGLSGDMSVGQWIDIFVSHRLSPHGWDKGQVRDTSTTMGWWRNTALYWRASCKRSRTPNEEQKKRLKTFREGCGEWQ